MRMCSFPGCTRLPHDSATPHARWVGGEIVWEVLAEQRTRAQIAREAEAAKLRERVEKIARRVAGDAWHEEPENTPGPTQSHNYNMRLNAARAAALAALTERESA